MERTQVKLGRFYSLLLIIMGIIAFPISIATAQVSTSDLFKVPAVLPTTGGPKLIPSSAYSSTYSGTNKTGDPFLQPTTYTPKNYIIPQYDAFDTTTKKRVKLPEPPLNTPPFADFTIITENGLGDSHSGTTNTFFIFDASASRDNEDSFGNLEARWDFENDGKVDSYFSRIKRIKHQFEKPGIYQVKLEILDSDGNVSTKIHQVTVVKNTQPLAYFNVNQKKGTKSTIFIFNTILSSDSQYQRNYLLYRFDWDSDGRWDTPLQNKTRWNHQFDRTGTFTVTMEVQDLEGLKDQAQIKIEIVKDNPPLAALKIERPADRKGQNLNRFIFDSSASSDDHTETHDLLFRWDFNYTGPDDIVFDTSFMNSPRYSWQYLLGGRKAIRLQVMDRDENITESFASINVPWIPSLTGILSSMK